MDWDKVDLSGVKAANPKTGRLSPLDFAKLTVAGKLIRKSAAACIQTAILTYLQRNWEEHERRLSFEAKERGMSPEDLFSGLAKGEIDLGDE